MFLINYMSRILIVEPQNYEELTGELDEVGIDYDVATDGEATELFSQIEYDAVVGPGDNELYDRAVTNETPFLAYGVMNDSVLGTDTLTGEAKFDARRVAAYTDEEGFESYKKELATLVEAHDDLDLFMDMLQHDIKNDVHVAESYFHLLDVESGQEDREEVIEERLESINRLMDSVGSIRGLEEDIEEEIYLNSVFDNLETSYDTISCQEGFDIDFTIEECINVSAGPLLIDMYEQIIENSINHSQGSQIHVTAEDGERPLVVVEDDGRGIPENIQDNLFQEGVKGNETGNTGIGTTLIDRISDRYEIDIEVGESELGGAQFKLEHQPVEN